MKYRVFLILLFYFLSPTISQAKKIPQFPVSEIPVNLKENADAVIRRDISVVNINSIYNLKYDHIKAVTILNESGENYADVTIAYNKSISISNLQISIYNALGMQIEKVKTSEIEDYSASGESLFSDTRIKHYQPIQKNYPYTIVYSYQQSLNEYTTIAGWYPNNGKRCSVQESSYKIVSSTPDSFQYKMYNSDLKPKIAKENNKSTYTWETTNLQAYKSEPYSSPYSYNGPLLLCAPTQFQYDKINGKTNSWNSLAKWFAALNKDRDILDETSKSKIKELVKDCSSDFEKIKAIYEYLQGKTRYVSIQVGIGSQQPFPAQFVEEKSYGDCKALSNYMKALLKVVNIPSNYTIITSARTHADIDTSFVRNFGNHVILMVPLQKDTVWLECTSKFRACGFLGTSTDDRTVLCIDENGGKLVRTTAYKMNDNQQIQSANIQINNDGTAQAKVTTVYSGLQHSNIASLFHVSIEDQKKKLYSQIDLPDFKIINHSISQNKTRIPKAELNLELDIRNYASKSGNRLFIPLNILNRSTYIPKKVSDRKSNVYYKREYCDTDSIHFIIPEGYKIESSPKEKSIETDFGNYNSKIVREGNKITYIRKEEYKKFEYPAERYVDFRNYKKAIVRADKAKLVLIQEAL